MHPLNVYIGYDPRESVAFHVCVNSIIRNSSQPVRITPIALNTLQGYVPRNVTMDGYPPSNQFSFSRFLVPFLNGWQGLALFIDGDMVVDGDIAELFDKYEWGRAVQVVKHDYTPKGGIKYLDSVQRPYPRKNWSSVVMWDCNHFKNRKLTPEWVAVASGAELHRFSWLEDFLIGDLDPAWNHLVGEENQSKVRKLTHWTRGTPCFKDYQDEPYAMEWWKEYNKTIHSNNASDRIVKVPIV